MKGSKGRIVLLKYKSLKINAALNITKQLCQVLFPLISIPYVTRVLGTDNYGVFNYGNSIVSYFVLIAALGINSYAIREGVAFRNDKEKIARFVSEIFTINIISTFISYSLLMMLLVSPFLTQYKRIIAIQSLSIILTTIGTDWINTIYEDFVYITIRYIIFQMLSLACMFVFVHKPDDYLVYAVIVVGAQAGANILNIFHVRKYVHVRLTKEVEWKKHLRPILVFFANIVAITIYVNSDITMLGIMRSDSEVGVYTLASKIYTIVKQILNAIMVVTLPRLSLFIKKGQKNEFNSLLMKIEKTVLFLVFPATIGMIFLSRQIVLIAGGIEYLMGSDALKILSFAIIFSLLATFYTSCVLVPLKLEKYVLTATIVSAIANVLLNFYFIPHYGINGAAATTLISEIIVFIIALTISLKNGKPKLEVSYVIKILAGSVMVIISCFFASCLGKTDWSYTALSIIISVLAYFGFEFLVRNDILLEESRKVLSKIRNKL